MNRDDGDEESLEDQDFCALMSEESLAESWNRPEEDAAWSYLQSAINDDGFGEPQTP